VRTELTFWGCEVGSGVVVVGIREWWWVRNMGLNGECSCGGREGNCGKDLARPNVGFASCRMLE